MIVDLPSTTAAQVNSQLVELRERGSAALGRVLTLVIATQDGNGTEEAVEAANDAAREHPSRVMVVARASRSGAPRMDAQLRIGGDAGASEVIVLRLSGPPADAAETVVVPLLLPDTPTVTWWPDAAPRRPADDPLGAIAQRRITDAAAEREPVRALRARAQEYTAGDTDLAWTRLTLWRAQLVAALDLPPHEPVVRAEVTGESASPSTELLAAWLAEYLRVPVRRAATTAGTGIVSASLERRCGTITVHRPSGDTATLTQPGQPACTISLRRRSLSDVLTEELRRLGPDEVYERTLDGLARLHTSEEFS